MSEAARQDEGAEGGCQCGALRYRVRLSEALTLYRCHCRECQKQTSSAFGMSMILPEAAFSMTRGEPLSWSSRADSGRIVNCFFCGACGCRLLHKSPSRPGRINLKPGTLDDTTWLQPVVQVWTKAAQPWLRLTGDLPSFPGQPEDLPALLRR